MTTSENLRLELAALTTDNNYKLLFCLLLDLFDVAFTVIILSYYYGNNSRMFSIYDCCMIFVDIYCFDCKKVNDLPWLQSPEVEVQIQDTILLFDHIKMNTPTAYIFL